MFSERLSSVDSVPVHKPTGFGVLNFCLELFKPVVGNGKACLDQYGMRQLPVPAALSNCVTGQSPPSICVIKRKGCEVSNRQEIASIGEGKGIETNLDLSQMYKSHGPQFGK